MTYRVTGAQSVLLALTGIIGLSALGFSGLGFSQGIDWDNGAKFNAESSGFIGPQLLPTELAEELEVSTGGSQPVNATVTSAPVTSAHRLALTPEQEQQIRLAYGTYLASRVGAGYAIVSGQVTRVQPLGQRGTNDKIIQETSPNNLGEEDALTTASIALEKTTSTIARAEVAIIAPVPAPASLRPILRVQPASGAVVQPGRAVSVDHLVHVDAPRSWPRRLDQVNNNNQVSIARGNPNPGGNIFLQDWQNNPHGSNNDKQFRDASRQFSENLVFSLRQN